MQILVVVPIKKEIDFFRQSCREQGCLTEEAVIGRLPVTRLPELGLIVASGGLGKTQFAVQTQHLIEAGSGWDVVICAGAGGALDDALAVGDVVVATETVEHDIYNRFGQPLLPRFSSAEAVVESFRRQALRPNGFRIHFGPIASGDEDVADPARRAEVQIKTGALAVAWEGAGGARACQFSGVPYLEIRGISDGANSTAATDFAANLEQTMRNVVTVITNWAGSNSSQK